MICVSISEPTVEACLDSLAGLTFAEVRLDSMQAVPEDMKTIFSLPLTLIATFRPAAGSNGRVPSADTRKEFLAAAIDAGASYIDIELDSDVAYRTELIEKAWEKGCRVIISFHDHHRTPDFGSLLDITSRCFQQGAHIAKIACRVNSERDCLFLLNVPGIPHFKNRTVVVGMGAKGRVTRIAAPLLGSPFTFASLSPEKKTAEGQIDKDILEKILRVLNDE